MNSTVGFDFIYSGGHNKWRKFLGPTIPFCLLAQSVSQTATVATRVADNLGPIPAKQFFYNFLLFNFINLLLQFLFSSFLPGTLG